MDQQLGRSLLARHMVWQVTDKNENFLTGLSERVDRRWGSWVVTKGHYSTQPYFFGFVGAGGGGRDVICEVGF